MLSRENFDGARQIFKVGVHECCSSERLLLWWLPIRDCFAHLGLIHEKWLIQSPIEFPASSLDGIRAPQIDVYGGPSFFYFVEFWKFRDMSFVVQSRRRNRKLFSIERYRWLRNLLRHNFHLLFQISYSLILFFEELKGFYILSYILIFVNRLDYSGLFFSHLIQLLVYFNHILFFFLLSCCLLHLSRRPYHWLFA